MSDESSGQHGDMPVQVHGLANEMQYFRPIILLCLFGPWCFQLILELWRQIVKYQIFPLRVIGIWDSHRFSLWTRRIARIRYILWQFVLGITFYTFPFSQFVKNLASPSGYEKNIAFHSFQLFACILFMITSLINPGVYIIACVASICL